MSLDTAPKRHPLALCKREGNGECVRLQSVGRARNLAIENATVDIDRGEYHAGLPRFGTWKGRASSISERTPPVHRQ